MELFHYSHTINLLIGFSDSGCTKIFWLCLPVGSKWKRKCVWKREERKRLPLYTLTLIIFGENIKSWSIRTVVHVTLIFHMQIIVEKPKVLVYININEAATAKAEVKDENKLRNRIIFTKYNRGKEKSRFVMGIQVSSAKDFIFLLVYIAKHLPF